MTNNTQPRLLRMQPDESDAFYARRRMDPLAIAQAAPETRLDVARADELSMQAAIERGDSLEAIEFGVDAAYCQFGIADYSETAKISAQTRNLIQNDLNETLNLDPVKELKLTMHMLDMQTISVASNYLALKEIDPEKARRSEKLLESALKQVIIDGAKTLNKFQTIHEESQDPKLKQALRGAMFELLYATFSRYESYENETYDEEFTITATEFNDMSAMHFDTRNHNFDVMTLDAKGSILHLIQCKNTETDKVYEDPIEMVIGTSFRKFMNNSKKYVSAINKLLTNNVYVSEAVMRSGYEELKELFDIQSSRARSAGKIALQSTNN